MFEYFMPRPPLEVVRVTAPMSPVCSGSVGSMIVVMIDELAMTALPLPLTGLTPVVVRVTLAMLVGSMAEPDMADPPATVMVTGPRVPPTLNLMSSMPWANSSEESLVMSIEPRSPPTMIWAALPPAKSPTTAEPPVLLVTLASKEAALPWTSM